MAEAIVGGAFLSGFINVVFDRLLSPEAVNLIQGKKLDQELLERLKLALHAAEALLVDAEKKQFHDTRVKNWLDDLKDAVYDLLDHVFTKAATQHREVSNFPRFLNFKDREMVPKVEVIVRKIELLEKHKYMLGLKEIAKENLSRRTPSTSIIEGEIYGRENDKEALIKLLELYVRVEAPKGELGIFLIGDQNGFPWRWKIRPPGFINLQILPQLVKRMKLADIMTILGSIDIIMGEKAENTRAKISVIPIVGMGGVGKTTLAQWLYNNEDLMKEFDLKAWVCVSEDFKTVKITQTIIETVTKSLCDLKDLNLLQLDLKDRLIGKKFFIILDDVWNDDYEDWNNLRKPFQYGNNGSKILVTTRSKNVASVVQTCPPYLLNELSDEYCWSVFSKHACFLESNENPNLEKIGREIVKKCKGLPLAAQTLGGLLRVKHDVKEWNTILTSEVWEFSIKESKIIPALLISYYDLPPHLKRCFVYCSLYPKDYAFCKHDLILLWMAEDLLPPPKGGKTLEEVGYDCFNDLASRLFFQQFRTIGGSFVMHDLIHDLATFIAGEFYYRSEEHESVDEMSMRTRHVSYGRLSHPISKKFDAFGRVKPLRTLLPIDFSTPLFSIGSILAEFKCLRVLSFVSFQDLFVLPDSIGGLIHLRYLDLSQIRIKTLPESLCNLYNLQTLKLCGCRMLMMLPNGMQNLVNLRHLYIDQTNLKEMPQGMRKLKCLQHLEYFIVGKHEENGIMELGELSNIHGSLFIKKLDNVGSSSEALKARIMDKRHIEILYLQWSTDGDMAPSIDSEIERDILDGLQPHKGLQDLTINRYRGTRFPDWVGHSSYHNMINLSLRSCSNCCRLPSLGQLPSLKVLSISHFNGLEKIGEEFYKSDDGHSSLTLPFPSLEYLSFCGMSCWEVWHSSESNAFPQLKTLIISDCPRLTGHLPNHLLALRTLEIIKCHSLKGDLPSHLACLQSLSIRDCLSAISFPGDRIYVSLKKVEICDCRKVEFPRQEQQHELLESLSIARSCDSLTSFPLDNFPKLKSLTLEDCENLESLSMSQPQDVALHRLEIKGCPNLVSFHGKGLAAPNMIYFRVSNCSKFKSLPCHMNTLLPKLVHLWISSCPEIELFPEGGWPPNLYALIINNCEKLLSGLSSMGLQQGPAILQIGGPCESVQSFPKQGLLPPLPSVTTLALFAFSCVETLDCKELLHLTSLQELLIKECPKLENMTGERLPTSLIKLEIEGSPLLEERCKMKDPKIWPKISHIPSIEVNSKCIT